MSVLSLLDWIIIVAYFVFSFGIAVWYYKKAGKNTEEFFLSGRELPWWIAGTSMVATTFAADTPIAVTEFVAKRGIARNWFWWNLLFGGVLTVFFFARLWRRADIQTEVEFCELRYSGKPAAYLRGFKALYLGIFFNCMIIGWVNIAMAKKILPVIFPLDGLKATFPVIEHSGLGSGVYLVIVAAIMIFVAIYSALSGLWGVAITDFFQFILAISGTIILAVMAVNVSEVGGIDGLKEQVADWRFKFFPDMNRIAPETWLKQEGGGTASPSLLEVTFLGIFAYIGVAWWSVLYPGAEPGGGGYIVQRMMSAKDEKHSFFATMWFTIAHYALRPWPWILVGLVSLVLFPELPLEDKGRGYVLVMKEVLPSGLFGLLVASFLAAYMSTITTQLNWGTSYVINDFYKRFIETDADEKRYVLISRITTLLVMAIGLLVTAFFDQVSKVWSLLFNMTAGVGLVLILRWYWWRINAWSEFAGFITPLITAPIVLVVFKVRSPYSLFPIVGITTLVWVVVTYVTRPTSREKLHQFYKTVHPGGVGWKHIDEQLPEVEGDSGYTRLFIDWVVGCILVLSSLFAIGKIIFGNYTLGLIFSAIAIASVYYIYQDLQEMGWETITE